MLFNSVEFFVFLPLVFFIYWLIPPRLRNLQNIWLLVASYFFYGWWDYRFLVLIALSSAVDYLAALAMDKESRHKRLWVGISLLVNLGALGFFKYYDFFITSFMEAFTFLGLPLSASTLGIVLPVGISFYTFQTLSYTLDVYRGKIRPTGDALAFFSYVSFFPQLVAGPIERAAHLLPQFHRQRSFSMEDGRQGLRLILWGLFKKVVVADTCAVYADEIFASPHAFDSSTLFIGALCFTFQIYGDFSGYSDIAIGSGRLFGFQLVRNFNLPYFSRSIAEFWRRWHMSLTDWFRTYLYIPLGGSRTTRILVIRNVWIIFLVSGLWHGANWTFVIWGVLHALYFMPSLLMGTNRKHLNEPGQLGWMDVLRMLWTFFLVVLAWVFFRAQDLESAIDYLHGIFALSGNDWYGGDYLHLAMLLIIWEWLTRKRAHGLDFGRNTPVWLRWPVYFFLTGMILYWFGAEKTFIYFQF